ncbi:MAG: flagellar FliJ family protein, partial [Gammaproteobacteria bacterium]|nr:flagellar FliJ family protein [Gammaproteobacteria bacterium]
MKRSQKLNPVVDIAAKATDAALIKVGEANAQWSKDKQQLEDLQQYKAEYLIKLRQGDHTLMNAQKILELRGFLAQLDQAIHAQEQQVATSLRT